MTATVPTDPNDLSGKAPDLSTRTSRISTTSLQRLRS